MHLALQPCDSVGRAQVCWRQRGDYFAGNLFHTLFVNRIGNVHATSLQQISRVYQEYNNLQREPAAAKTTVADSCSRFDAQLSARPPQEASSSDASLIRNVRSWRAVETRLTAITA